MLSIRLISDLSSSKKVFTLIPYKNSEKDTILSHYIEFNECLNILENILENVSEHNQNEINILKMTIFINSANNEDFISKTEELTSIIKSKFQYSEFPFLFVAQAPVNSNVSLEVLASTIQNSKYENGVFEGVKYCIIRSGENLEIYGTMPDEKVSSSDRKSSVYDKVLNNFIKIQKLLELNNLGFGNIVRQWGYIGGITNYELRITNDGVKEEENYQMYNKARAETYKSSEWKYGYPAATGIGTNVKGCSMEFIATNFNPMKIIIPLKNPGQTDAYEYSGKSFNNQHNNNDKSKSGTPKFERGKIVISGDSLDLYVSGTAAIIGEESVYGDIYEQTRTTIANIMELCSKENLLKHGINLKNDLPNFTSIRAYIKNRNDAISVEKLCKDAFGDVPILCVIADVCRKELLVEIEAYLNCKIERTGDYKI